VQRPHIDVCLDDSWSTDRITPAGREKLRASGFAPPAPRQAAAPTLVQLQSNAHRCPYCGSTGHAAREHLRTDPLQIAALLRDLQAAVRAVQDDLVLRDGCLFPRTGRPARACSRVLGRPVEQVVRDFLPHRPGPANATGRGYSLCSEAEGAFLCCLKFDSLTDGGQIRSSVPVASRRGARAAFLKLTLVVAFGFEVGGARPGRRGGALPGM